MSEPVRPREGRTYWIRIADSEILAEYLGDYGTAPGLPPHATQQQKQAQPGGFMFRIENDQVVYIQQDDVLREN